MSDPFPPAAKRRRTVEHLPYGPAEVTPPTGQAHLRLPGYGPMLSAFHRAFADELRSMLATLPIAAGASLLDAACGDGAYSVWLARRVGKTGRVTAVDLSADWLAVAAGAAEENSCPQIDFCRASVTRLPAADAAYDGVWCAQSLYSLPDTVGCLTEMARVVRPGGFVGVLENDALHHILLPWPIELELELQAAEFAAFQHRSAHPTKYYIGRSLTRLLRRVGLVAVQQRSFATTRQAPLSEADRRYLTEFLADMRQRVAPFLSGRSLARVDRLVDPAGRRFLLNGRDLAVVCLDRIVWGKKKGHATGRKSA